MDKTTKTFVIAACSVVIATPVVWLGLEFLKARRIDEIQRTAQLEAAEKARRANRAVPCYDRSKEMIPYSEEQTRLEVINKRSEWLVSCSQSTEPVETFTKY